ncbi:MAG: hypothetical protein GY809_11700, partial [Planctomycetes bacterium]|nr:hypothetical protein [Planctomycetota bacterium]
MFDIRRFNTTSWLSCVLFLCLFSLLHRVACAGDIPGLADVQGGVIVYVGHPDAGLLAELGAGPGRLVHALSRDRAEVEKARADLLARQVYGKI